MQKGADDATKDVNDTTRLMQHAVETRKKLESIQKQITAAEDKAKKALEDHQRAIDQLNKTADERRGNIGKSLLEMPILDAFNSPLKPANRWLPQLPWNNNFRDVARFDRCETCHLGMEKTAAGAAKVGGFPPISQLKLEMRTPDIAALKKGKKSPVASETASKDAAATNSPGLDSFFGLAFAREGVFSPSDVTVSAVYPTIKVTPAESEKLGFGKRGLFSEDKGTEDKASAGRQNQPVQRQNQRLQRQSKCFQRQIRFTRRHSLAGGGGRRSRGRRARGDQRRARVWRRASRGMILEPANWGKPLRLSIRRGVPQPFTSHPRLDLYVGSLSPHPVAKFGCTICHQGQGSATSFKWSSHSPNDIESAKRWSREHEWFNNENWTYPMYARRFEQSTCLKCHHEVMELEASRDNPDPPAPKVVEGYEIIRRYGCFGCHEINGFDGPNRRVGPDLRLEPNYAAAAEQLRFEKGPLVKVSPAAVEWASELAAHPDNDAVRHRLLEVVSADARLDVPVIPGAKRLEGVLKDSDTPGTQRKVGPSLRHVADKLSYDFMASWIANPKNFRPDTRMPRFFGQWDHLDGKGLADAQRLEPVEIPRAFGILAQGEPAL